MKNYDVEKILSEFVRPVYDFALKKCRTAMDAEDMAQEIMLKAYKAFLYRDDIYNYKKYFWTIAHNVLANYYRHMKTCYMNLPINNMTENNNDLEAEVIGKETVRELQKKIAYLSYIQRKVIIGYYYENKRITQIAEESGVSVAMVKWHLFESKKNLKRGIENMETRELNFNPIKFSLMGFSGSAGEMGGTSAFFRSALAQNIAYCVYRKNKTVNEIADELGVSPVYVASEAEYLSKYGYLIKKGNTYLANIIIDDADETSKIYELQEKMYTEAAKLYANELYNVLINSRILQDDDIECCNKSDTNYLLWALVPYIAANDVQVKEEITFEECATRRIDGSFDIANATIGSPYISKSKYFDSLQKWCGPSWINSSGNLLWCCSSEWNSERNMKKYANYKNLQMLLRILNNEFLSIDEYASLAEMGFIKMEDKRPLLRVVWLKSHRINERLLEIGKSIRFKYASVFSQLKKPYEEATLALTPKHLRKSVAYGLQYLFYADGWFEIYVLKELLSQGKLKLPSTEQRDSLMTVLYS